MAFEKDLFFFRRKEISHDIDFKRVRVNHQGESRKTDAFGYTLIFDVELIGFQKK
jgi:hypothetical protein